MTQAAFAEKVGKKAKVDPTTIIVILTALLTMLPTLLSLCQPSEPEPPERAIKRTCRNNPVLARREIRKAMKPGTERRVATSREMCAELAKMPEKQIKAMLEE